MSICVVPVVVSCIENFQQLTNPLLSPHLFLCLNISIRHTSEFVSTRRVHIYEICCT
jgi:hypothetical protein